MKTERYDYHGIEKLQKRIRELMEETHLSAYRLAQTSGLPASTVKDLAAGRTKNPNIDTLMGIANGFDMTLSEFFDCDYF